jgi:hypothetical protein
MVILQDLRAATLSNLSASAARGGVEDVLRSEFVLEYERHRALVGELGPPTLSHGDSRVPESDQRRVPAGHRFSDLLGNIGSHSGSADSGRLQRGMMVGMDADVEAVRAAVDSEARADFGA